MSSKKLLTVFGATGNQGGSVIDVVLARPELSAKYALRGITRDPSSEKSKKLSSKGVEMVQAELDNLESLKTAVKGSYGVFGVTDFWSVMDKNREVQQGKNIFEACKTENVTHFVFSTLPHVIKLTNGALKHVEHFDGKAEVREYAEAHKGDLSVSYFMPAMFLSYVPQLVKVIEGTPTLSLPYPSDSIAWPLLDPRRDSGRFVLGLFEAGSKANGVAVNGVSTWTTPKDVVAALSKASGKEVVFKTIPADVFAGFLPENVRNELLETQLLIGDYSYYGKGEEKNQAKHDEWLIKDADLIDFPRWIREHGPIQY